MKRHLISFILIFLIVGVFKSAIGLKWIPIRMDDKIPKNAISIDDSHTKWVGRSNMVGQEIYPAQIYNHGAAAYKPYQEETLLNKHSEILTISESDNCKWKPYYYSENYQNIDQNVVRAGVDSNGDPVFIGRTYVRDNDKSISSIYLPNKKYTQRWAYVDPDDHPFEQWQYLSCDTNIKWVDSLPTNPPENAVSGGESVDGYDIYVARWKPAGSNNFITGYVIPKKGAAVFGSIAQENSDSDEYDNGSQDSDSDVFQILTGESGEYDWVTVGNGIVPDYAVVNGRHNLELLYVARINKSIRQITQTEAREQKSPFDILVKNEI
ncbi:uncharacterized protein LOC129909045 [Episyrphus balteatus]|uniref:uncharacterized protein LOC129909045 n=1 Tax=Episyrphus balteatus TaxID=286459 RepID=UPI0024852F17|nr:uncharacterized protein LOC129909045 [Episyrphus balteatus]